MDASRLFMRKHQRKKPKPAEADPTTEPLQANITGWDDQLDLCPPSFLRTMTARFLGNVGKLVSNHRLVEGPRPPHMSREDFTSMFTGDEDWETHARWCGLPVYVPQSWTKLPSSSMIIINDTLIYLHICVEITIK